MFQLSIRFVVAAFLIFLILFLGVSFCSKLICMYVELLYYQVYVSFGSDIFNDFFPFSFLRCCRYKFVVSAPEPKKVVSPPITNIQVFVQPSF